MSNLTLADGSENYLDRTLETSFEELQELMDEPNTDFMRVMEQAYKVLLLLNRRAARTDKMYAQDKEPEIRMHIHDVKGTFNRKDVLAIQCFFAGLTILGGFATMGSLVPLPLGAETLKGAGTALGQIGQGGGSIGNAFANNAESQRKVCEFELEESKRRRGDRDDSERKNADQQRQALSDWKSMARTVNEAFKQMASPAA